MLNSVNQHCVNGRLFREACGWHDIVLTAGMPNVSILPLILIISIASETQPEKSVSPFSLKILNVVAWNATE